MRDPAARVIVMLMLALLTAGCGSLPSLWTTVDPLGGGQLGDGAWTAVAYVSGSEGACVEIRYSRGEPSRICGGDEGRLGVWVSDAPSGQGVVVAAQVTDGRATNATLVLVDGRRLPVPVLAASPSTGLRVAIIGVEAGDVPDLFQLLDEAGATVADVPLR